MLRENTVFAHKIIDFYTDKGIECSVVDEHSTLLVTLTAEDKTHEFRYGSRAFAGIHYFKKFCAVLEKEWGKLKSSAPEASPDAGSNSRRKYRIAVKAGEEANLTV